MSRIVEDIPLHPDNLVRKKRYRVAYFGIEDPSVTFVDEGVFEKLASATIRVEEGKKSKRRLVAVFTFKCMTVNHIEWYRIQQIQLISLRKSSDKKIDCDPEDDK